MGTRNVGTTSAVLTVVAAAALVLASGGALGGDNVALFAFEPNELEADPGEEVVVEVVMTSHGGYGGEGVENVSFALDYDPDLLSVTDLKAGPWLEGDGAEVAVDRGRDGENGETRLNQRREPAGEGATGTAPVATATFEVREDAEPTNATLTITGSNVELVTGDPQSTMVRDAVVVINGGGPADDAGNAANREDGDDPEGVTLADDEGAGAGEEADDAEDATGETGADDEPSLPLLVGVGTLAFVAMVGLAAIALRRRDPGV